MSLITKKYNGLDPFWTAFDMAFFGQPWQTFSTGRTQESADDYTISIDMPGVMEDDIDISVKNDALAIKAQRNGKEVHNKQYILPPNIDAERIRANLDHGVLTVTVPKSPENKPRKILINRRE